MNRVDKNWKELVFFFFLELKYITRLIVVMGWWWDIYERRKLVEKRVISFYIGTGQLTDRQFIGYLRHKAVNRWRSWTVPVVEQVLAQTAGITRETAINFLRIYGTPTRLARDASGERCSRDVPVISRLREFVSSGMIFFKILEDENSNSPSKIKFLARIINTEIRYDCDNNSKYKTSNFSSIFSFSQNSNYFRNMFSRD